MRLFRSNFLLFLLLWTLRTMYHCPARPLVSLSENCFTSPPSGNRVFESDTVDGLMMTSDETIALHGAGRTPRRVPPKTPCEV